MGYAARANPLAHEGAKTFDDVETARLARWVSQIPSQQVYEQWLAGFPAASRDAVREMTVPHCTFPMGIVVTDAEVCGRRKGCKRSQSAAPHICPYQRELHNDHNQEYCRCCGDCEQECSDDI